MKLEVVSKVDYNKFVDVCAVLTDYSVAKTLPGIDYIGIDEKFSVIVACNENVYEDVLGIGYDPAIMCDLFPEYKNVTGKIVCCIDLDNYIIQYNFLNGVVIDSDTRTGLILEEKGGKINIYYFDEVFYLLLEEKMTKKVKKQIRKMINGLMNIGFVSFVSDGRITFEDKKEEEIIEEVVERTSYSIMTIRYRHPFVTLNIEKLKNLLKEDYGDYKIEYLKIKNGKKFIYLITNLEAKDQKTLIGLDLLISDFLKETAQPSAFKSDEFIKEVRKFDFELNAFLESRSILGLDQIYLFDKTKAIYFKDFNNNLYYVNLDENAYKALIDYLEDLSEKSPYSENKTISTTTTINYPLYYKEFIIA